METGTILVQTKNGTTYNPKHLMKPEFLDSGRF